jgi:hypothetical protein
MKHPGCFFAVYIYLFLACQSEPESGSELLCDWRSVSQSWPVLHNYMKWIYRFEVLSVCPQVTAARLLYEFSLKFGIRIYNENYLANLTFVISYYWLNMILTLNVGQIEICRFAKKNSSSLLITVHTKKNFKMCNCYFKHFSVWCINCLLLSFGITSQISVFFRPLAIRTTSKSLQLDWVLK